MHKLTVFLSLFGIGVGIIMRLLPQTLPYVITSLVVIFGVWAYPVWNFWWIEKSLWLRIAALMFLAGFLCILGYTVLPEQKNEEIIHKLSEFVNKGTIIQAQCAGGYLDDFKPGETTHSKFVKWCQDVDDYFRQEKTLDFERYHSWFENTSKHHIPSPEGLSEYNTWVYKLLEGRKRNLTEMIDALTKH